MATRWLDIGYGEGAFLAAARESAWDCYGTEISPQALAYGNRQGWAVTHTPETDYRFVAGEFDIVTMIEVIEHVPDPDEFFRDAARWLRPGGLLYVTTPNAMSLNRRLLGLDWSVVAPPEHLTLWTAQGLRSALSRAGFTIRSVRTDGLNPAEVLARWRRAAPPNRNQTAVALNSFLSTSPRRRWVKLALNRCLSAFRVGDALKVAAVLDSRCSD